MLSVLLAAPLAAQVVDHDPTVLPFHQSTSVFAGGGGQSTASTSGCDHFNRSNSFDLGASWVVEGGSYEIRSEFLRSRNSEISLAIFQDAAADYRTSKVSSYFQTNGQKLYYIALVAGYQDEDNCVHVKVQDADYDTLVDRVYFRYGNNKAPWNAQNYFFDLETPTAFGTMTLTFRNNGDVARLEIDNPFSGEVEIFECSGLSAKAGLLGSGFGVGTYGDCYVDDFDVNDGTCPEGFEMNVSGTPGTRMTFEILGATPNEFVAVIFGNGAGSSSIPNNLSCAGTTIGMTTPLDYVPARADAAGTVILSTNVPAGAAGSIYVQAVDITTCEVTDAILL